MYVLFYRIHLKEHGITVQNLDFEFISIACNVYFRAGAKDKLTDLQVVGAHGTAHPKVPRIKPSC